MVDHDAPLCGAHVGHLGGDVAVLLDEERAPTTERLMLDLHDGSLLRMQSRSERPLDASTDSVARAQPPHESESAKRVAVGDSPWATSQLVSSRDLPRRVPDADQQARQRPQLGGRERHRRPGGRHRASRARTPAPVPRPRRSRRSAGRGGRRGRAFAGPAPPPPRGRSSASCWAARSAVAERPPPLEDAGRATASAGTADRPCSCRGPSSRLAWRWSARSTATCASSSAPERTSICRTEASPAIVVVAVLTDGGALSASPDDMPIPHLSRFGPG